jgi:hypothetical protein
MARSMMETYHTPEFVHLPSAGIANTGSFSPLYSDGKTEHG